MGSAAAVVIVLATSAARVEGSIECVFEGCAHESATLASSTSPSSSSLVVVVAVVGMVCARNVGALRVRAFASSAGQPNHTKPGFKFF
uniref:Putative secreted protein n=1 Tax=Anopheles marajoara TaxID=58244 RepID=A0A2M4CAT8_9DIPT